MEKNNIFESRHGFRRRMTISWIAPRNVFQSVGIFLFHQSIQLPAGLKVLRVCVCVCVLASLLSFARVTQHLSYAPTVSIYLLQ